MELGKGFLQGCGALETLYLPNTIAKMGWIPLYGCNALKNVYMAQNFNTNNFNLSCSTLYSVETIMSWGEALYDRTGLDPYTLTIGATNIAKLTDEQIAIFTNKNWTLV